MYTGTIEPQQYNNKKSLPHDIFLNMKIYVSKNISFKFIGNEKLFSYVGVQPSYDTVRAGLNEQWHDSWMPRYYYGRPLYWWSAQLAAAIYMATTACDIDKTSLTHPDPLIRSFFIFHVYYTVRKLLYDCELPLPGDRAFDAKSNGTVQQIEKLRQMLKHYGNPTKLKNFLLPDGPDGLFWDKKKEKYYFIDNKTGEKVVLVQEPTSYTDYTWKDDGIFSALAESARKTFHKGTTKYHLTGKRKYPNFEKRMKIDQYKWMKVIDDGMGNGLMRPMTSTGAVLINKSLMVYFYCIIASQSAYGGWSEATRGLIEESFAKNVNSFTTNEPRFESKDLNDYYKFAKLNSTTTADFSLGEGILLIPRDMRLKQTDTSKKVYKTKESVDKPTVKPVSKGVSTVIVKPKKHNVDAPKPTTTKHVPLKIKVKGDNNSYTELTLFAVGVASFLIYRNI